MAGIQQEVDRSASSSNQGNSAEPDKIKGIRDDIEEEDVEESYYRYIQYVLI